MGIEELVAQLEYNESIIRNIDIRVDFYDFRRSSLEPPHAVENYRRLEKARYVYDDMGRIRLEQENCEVIGDGEYASEGSWSCMTYDKDKGMFIGAGAPGNRIITIFPDNKAGNIRKPTNYLSDRGRLISKLLRDAQDAGRMPVLKYLENGELEVTVTTQGSPFQTKVFVLDPSRSYALTKAETIVGERKLDYCTVELVDAGGDIFLPGEVLHQTFSYPGGEQTLEYEMKMVLREFSVNSKSIDESLFEEEIHDGDYLRDTRAPIPVSRYVGSEKVDHELVRAIAKELRGTSKLASGSAVNRVGMDESSKDTSESTLRGNILEHSSQTSPYSSRAFALCGLAAACAAGIAVGYGFRMIRGHK